ncbi:MAG: DUF6259 domain-containing protein [Candidatus Izemoplasmatales bacterium]|nr:DUF6259 domain-containing protein [Candidatus Izemoplasmatales bacterium]
MNFILNKKIFLICIGFLLTLTIVACHQATQTTSTEENFPTQPTTSISTQTETTQTTTNQQKLFNIVDNPYYLSVKNNQMSLILQKNDGSMTSLKNEITKIDYLLDSDGHNWFMVLDPSTANPFLTDPGSEGNLYLSSRMFYPVISYRTEDDQMHITLRYDLTTHEDLDLSGLSVVQTITWNYYETELSISYRLENYTSFASVVISFTGMILSGLSESNHTLDLFWSDKEGRVREDVVPSAQTQRLAYKMAYPSPYSTQLMELYDEQGALYYFIEDPTREYKEFFFGVFDRDREHDASRPGNPVSMGVVQYPFVPFGQEMEIWQTRLGLSSNSGWYDGADLYRDFLLENGMDRTYNEYVETFTGFTNSIIAWAHDDFVQTYTGEFNPTVSIKSLDPIGIDSILLIGWHKGGFDSKYPDYEYYEGEYFGEDNFIKMVNDIHENGDYVLAYLNGHLAVENARWSSELTLHGITNMFASSIKKPGFRISMTEDQYLPYMYRERYGTGLDYYAMCRKDAAFQDILLEAVERLVSAGIDGLWFDQVMEMPAYLCFDPSHGHATPATASAEGYREIFTKIDDVFAKYGKTDYLLFAEGTTDAWIEYIDICGLMWGRLLYQANMSPNLTKYTIPAKFLGLSGYGTDISHAYAFLFGSPLVDAASVTDQKIIEVYKQNPSIYFRGRYLDMKGLQLSHSEIKGSIILSDDLKEIGVQLFNPTKQAVEVTITLSLTDLGLNGANIQEWHDLFDNSVISSHEATITITMEPNSITAYKAIID